MSMLATGGNIGNKSTGIQKDIIPKGYQKGQISNFTPDMMKLFQSLFGHLGPDSFLSKLASGDQSQFEQLEAPALRQFSGLQGNIASKFSGVGAGTRHGSGFQNTLNAKSSDFAQQLQSQRMDLQRNAIKDLMGFSNDLLQQRPYDQSLTEKKPSFLKQIAPGTIEALIKMIPLLL